MTDPFTSATAPYIAAMQFPHRTGPAFEVYRRKSRWAGPILRGLVSAVFGGATLFLITVILIGVR